MKTQVMLNRNLIKSLASEIAEEVATRLYYELLLAVHLPEIEYIKKKKIKALKGKQINLFLKRRIKELRK